MRVLYYNPLFHGNGGAATHAQGLAHGLGQLGHDVLVLPTLVLPALEPSGVPRRSMMPGPVMSGARTIRGIVRAGRLTSTCVAALRAFRPAVLIARRAAYDYVCDALIRTAGCSKVGEVNGVASVEAEELWGHRYDGIELARERAFLNACDQLCCVTAEVRNQVESLGVDVAKARIVPNGVDTDRFFRGVVPDPETMRMCAPCDAVVGYCASVSPLHDLRTVVDAARQLRLSAPSRLKFLFVGPTREDLERAGADRDLLDCCVAIGHVPHERVPSLMACMDAGCVALRNRYGSPLKIVEFLAMGVPVAVAAEGSGTDVVDSVGAGFVVASGDAAALATALATIVSSPEVRAECGARGAEWAGLHCGWDQVAQRMLP